MSEALLAEGLEKSFGKLKVLDGISFSVRKGSVLGLLGRTGRTEAAKRIAEKLEHMNANIRNCAYQVAVVYAGISEKERAIEWLERAWRTHQTLFPYLRVDSRFRPLNGHPRFRALIRHAGIAAGM